MAGKICAELYVLKIDICFSRWKEECSESLCSESERGREGGHSGFHHCVADNNRVYTHTHTYTYTYTYTCKCKHSHLFSGFHQHCDVEQQLCVYTYIVTPSANNQVLCCVQICHNREKAHRVCHKTHLALSHHKTQTQEKLQQDMFCLSSWCYPCFYSQLCSSPAQCPSWRNV